MSNNQYNDKERLHIAKQQYIIYEKGAQILTLDKKQMIGYVSEIKEKLSGENTYIVTDSQLSDNPTQEELATVGHVTVLYQGSTFKLSKPIETVVDWVINDATMAARIIVPDFVPTQPSVQLRDASDTLQETLKKYPNATISIYGHSLGSMNAQSAISDVIAEYDSRISGVYLYHGPNIYKTLNSQQRKNIERLHYKIFNYIDNKDFIGMGYDDGQAVGQVFKVDSLISTEGFIGQHNWGGYLYDEEGNLIHANGELVSPETRVRQIDINGDKQIDLVIGDIDPRVRNLLSTDKKLIIDTKSILVNPELLTVLANNLRTRLSEDMGQVLKLCRLCIEKNEVIDTNFEARKQKISESIKELFKSAGFPSLLYDVRNSVEVVMNQKSTLERCRDTYAELTYPFSASQTPLINGYEWNPFFYNTQLATLRHACDPLVTQIHQEKTHTFTSFFLGEQTLLGSWQQIDHATKQLLEESDRIFEGEGLRLGKKDGITDALTVVLATIEKNTTELTQSLESIVELIEGISTHFKQADEWLGTQLQQGHFVGTLPSPTVPQNYQAYLERDEIFDDVKDVLQAFDKQVEQKSRQYARKAAQVYSDVIGNFEQGLERWHTMSLDLRRAIVAITENYDVSVQVKEEVMVEKKVGEQLIQETKYPVHDWGRLEQLYPGEVTEMIRQLESRLLPKIDSIQQAIWKSNRVKNQLQYMEAPLKPIVEEGVYQAFDLDEIIKGQQQIIQIARRLEQEIGHVAQVIRGEVMAAKSIETLQQKLFDSQRLIKYYKRFVSDCFGDNEYSGKSESIPRDVSKFSLNTTMI